MGPVAWLAVVVMQIYGLQIISCRQLNGYDDKNYHLVTSGATSNPHLSAPAPEGYVLKIINSMDTQRPEILCKLGKGWE